MTGQENSNKGKITLGYVCSWLFGSLFLLSAIAGMFDPKFGTVLAVSFLTAALILLPPVREQVYKQTNKSLSGGLRVVVVLCVLVFGAASSPDFQRENQSIQTSSSASSVQKMLGHTSGDLVIEDVEFSKGQFGNKILTGILQNDGNREYSYVQIQFNLYDKDGVQIGSTLANVNNIEPHGKWKFEAAILQEGATMFKVKDITGF